MGRITQSDDDKVLDVQYWLGVFLLSCWILFFLYFIILDACTRRPDSDRDQRKEVPRDFGYLRYEPKSKGQLTRNESCSVSAAMAMPSSVVESSGMDSVSCDEFSWEVYFARTGAMAVDTNAFCHVERSQQSLRLTRDNSTESQTPDRRITAADSIEIGRFIDVQDERDPRTVWPAEILENVGGRLLLKYLCLQDAGPPFWEFYLSDRIHSAGICETNIGKELELHYALPSTCGDPGFIPSEELLQELADTAKANTLDKALFQGRPAPEPHQMEVGMWLEAVDPLGGSIFYPAVVVEVLNRYYFVLNHDASMISENNSVPSMDNGLLRTCHSGSHGLFPIGFAGQRGLSFAAPEGFDWAAYLRTNNGKMAHEKCFQELNPNDRFIPGRRLEAVNPSAPHQICAATIVRRVENLLWLHIDSSSHLSQTHIVDCSSTSLFPCGWCATYGYPLKAPYEHNLKDFKASRATLTNDLLKYSSERKFVWSPPDAQESAFMPNFWLPGSECPWSPGIYISPRCFTGPHVDRLRLSTKPRLIGPGPMVAVLKSVVGNVLSAAYRPREVLAELQPTSNSESPMMQIAEVKAKHRAKRWRGSVHVCVDPQQIPEWCRQLCIRLEACPGLLGFKPYLNDKCHFDCNRTPKNRRLCVAKPLSCNAAKRLKTRLAVQQKRLEAAEDSGQQQDDRSGVAPKRKRLKHAQKPESEQPTAENESVNRPVTRTRAAKLRRHVFENGNNGGIERSAGTLSAITECCSNNEGVNGDDFLESASESDMSIMYENGDDSFCVYCMDDIPASNGYRNEHENGFNGRAGSCHLRGCMRHRRDTGINLLVPRVDTNPLTWTPDQLYRWLRNTVISMGVADQLRDELIDGQAFMLMGLRDVQDYLGLKLGPALKVCGVIKELKTIFLKKYATQETKESVLQSSRAQCNGNTNSGDHVREFSVLDE